jgi:hypothetical protein
VLTAIAEGLLPDDYDPELLGRRSDADDQVEV